MVRKADPSKKGDLFDFVMRCIEKSLLEMVLGETAGNQIRAANVLGINRNTLRAKLKDLGIHQRR
ncbi:MAG: Fis family transcriptional regulator [Candidatus Tectomicrobia bacterium]|nr:Fis family transcriptional regulator [Candidatus Tectomicrobia bacterium]